MTDDVRSMLDDPILFPNRAAAESIKRTLGDFAADVRSSDGLLCQRCLTVPVWMVCCSSHGHPMCHRCYRLTHFVEVCAEGCRACADEGLPKVLSRNAAADVRTSAIPTAAQTTVTFTAPGPTYDLRSLLRGVDESIEAHQAQIRHLMRMRRGLAEAADNADIDARYDTLEALT